MGKIAKEHMTGAFATTPNLRHPTGGLAGVAMVAVLFVTGCLGVLAALFAYFFPRLNSFLRTFFGTFGGFFWRRLGTL